MRFFVTRFFVTVISTVSIALLVCSLSTAQPHQKKLFYPETPAGLENQISDLLAVAEEGRSNLLTTHVHRLVIPGYRSWFAQVFGPYRSIPLVDEYRRQSQDIRGMKDFFNEVVSKDQTEIEVVRLHDPEDLRARGLQKRAFLAMRYHNDLYTVALTKPGNRAGVKLWSFVYVDGMFRFAGKMRELTKVPLQ